MPNIHFCVLVPAAHRQRVADIFQTALDKLVAAGDLSAGKVEIDPNPKLYDGVEENLRQTYRDEHEDRELEDATVVGYDIAASGVKGSYNQLAMVLSRLLTPHAALPKDHVLLEDEKAHEKPAIFPWLVEVRR
ncbi:hypothetical protein CPHO_04545 [Corynebacterium phocae]|uniref:Uncharacterized protein n=1 Tax=Corynebacterium phocae TaxID=161895 RepID=A0A1L7D2G3_9CORY|nr:hypothetical protein [Corynebacterium phocae]APT92280.1 hypothetical protein CPHO_04545 [Corynebacterium phocae]KAA8725426.1 hypothetical protein F4V58_04090 [Corynebacterium phocae]